MHRACFRSCRMDLLVTAGCGGGRDDLLTLSRGTIFFYVIPIPLVKSFPSHFLFLYAAVTRHKDSVVLDKIAYRMTSVPDLE